MSHHLHQQKYDRALVRVNTVAKKSKGWPNDRDRVDRDLVTWSRQRPDLRNDLIRVGATLSVFLFL